MYSQNHPKMGLISHRSADRMYVQPELLQARQFAELRRQGTFETATAT